MVLRMAAQWGMNSVVWLVALMVDQLAKCLVVLLAATKAEHLVQQKAVPMADRMAASLELR